MNKVQRAKVAVELDRLKKEVERLEAKAGFEEGEFADAWLQYGSELAGPPGSIEINRNTAKRLKRKIDFLKKVQEGREGLERLPILEQSILIIDSQIQSLSDSKVAIYGEMEHLRYLQELIGKSG